MKNLLLFALLSLFYTQIFSQNTEWMDLLEELSESDEIDENSLEQLFDDLSSLNEHPINLKTATKADLERLPFLNPLQIENILYYVYQYKIDDISELKNVEDLDFRTFNYLKPFVCIEKTEEQQPLKLKNLLKYNKQEATLRYNTTLQQKAGYLPFDPNDPTDRASKHYVGEPYYLSLRYSLRYRDIQFGMAAEKDPGEAFWNSNHKGFDNYTFNFNLKNRGIIDDLHLGDYRLSFGQGLVLNTNFSMGKTTFITNIGQNSEGIKRHATTAETGYFRGAAVALKLGNTQTTIFGSHRNCDANTDSATIKSFKTDGYNRTTLDLEKRRTVEVNTFGGHFRWRNEALNIGLTAVYYDFGGKTLNPDPYAYNLFSLREKSFFNTGINYAYQSKFIVFQGESAIDRNGKCATIHTLLFNPLSSIEWIVSYRRYARFYNAFYARAFAESSTVKGETGFYSGLKISPISKWELSAYIDRFRFPWLKYSINSPSDGSDCLVQLIYRPRSDTQFQARYKYKEKSKNAIQAGGNETLVLPYEQHRWRFRADYSLGKQWSMSSQVDVNRYVFQTIASLGRSLSQVFTWSHPKGHLRIDGCVGYFRTDDYNSRISLHEKNILYAFSFPTYYGEGFRLYSVVRWKISKALTAYFKIGNTRYFDRDTVGSDLEMTEGRDRSDVYFLLKYGF